jgi:hypothetical protein
MARAAKTEVLVDLQPVADYKARIMVMGEKVGLDIREYIDKPEYTGFTRKGVRVWSMDALISLRAAVDATITEQQRRAATKPPASTEGK